MKKSTSWIIIAAFLIGIGALFGLFSGAGDGSGAPETLPANSQAARAQKLAADFPGGDALAAIVVFHTNQPLSQQQIGQLQAVPAQAAQSLEGAEPASPVIPAGPDTAQATINLPGDLDGIALSDAVDELRTAVKNATPEGVEALVTGPAGFAADTAAAFKGANFTLLGVTALVVAILLIITYRSPVLWLIPLLVTALADRAAAVLTGWLSETTGFFASDGSTAGITSVLVFGAGTNYALLMVSRYREELAHEHDHKIALKRAWKASIPAIVSSNLTVVLALQTLLLASVPSLRSLGISSSIGLLVALLFALVLLPAALNVCGRGLFWPKIPTVGHEQGGGHTFERIADTVDRNPLRFLVPLVIILLALGGGIFGTRIGLSSIEQFRTQSEAVDAAQLLGEASPIQIYVPTPDTDAAQKAISQTQGIDPVGQPQQSTNGDMTRLTAIVEGENTNAVKTLRQNLATDVGENAVVGGQLPQQIDNKAGIVHDMKVVVPLIFLAVLLVLIVVLRALLAPILLLAAAALSTWAAMGAGTLVSTHIFGFPGLDTSAPLYAVLFLIALGIDYTVFLVLRAKEEASAPGMNTRRGMVRAVGVTGGVITSAGIVLAAVFAVLGVLPLITLTQVGILVGFGIILDTFVVRTLVVPAIFALVGEKIWWPATIRSES
ncbi:hypothetical protein CAQU_11665 [Corynebacterium aquilae DSM 44791]|uniref:SSD domain-containing protein n=1 Tax=Corynebacterium aquilae DSM 44791 TaxID=1431546 RepID=A0A1L7CIF3_9CORY|nr:hypothetical protein CAQU_11665 [Corynebacterium aquilae DSM 44791]